MVVPVLLAETVVVVALEYFEEEEHFLDILASALVENRVPKLGQLKRDDLDLEFIETNLIYVLEM